MKRERCYQMAGKTAAGKPFVFRVRAGKKPDAKSQEALRGIAEAAYELLRKKARAERGA